MSPRKALLFNKDWVLYFLGQGCIWKNKTYFFFCSVYSESTRERIKRITAEKFLYFLNEMHCEHRRFQQIKEQCFDLKKRLDLAEEFGCKAVMGDEMGQYK